MPLKGYHSYRGRQGVRRWLLTVVLVLILLAACAFLFLQRFITYSDDGSFHLELPFFDFADISGDAQDGDDTQPQQDVNLVIDPPQDGQQDGQQGQQQQPPQSQQIPVTRPYAPRRLLEFSTLPANEAELMEALETVGADGFVFTAKNNEGEVFYTSGVALPGAVSATAVSSELVSRLCAQQGVYTVARINCFHDSLYAFANMEAAGICRKNGYIWYDFNLSHWLDPEKEAARRYVIDLALECAQLGFDEILLEDMRYPPSGNLYKIDYSKNTMAKTDALELFLTELRGELEPYGVRLSLLLDEAEATGTSDKEADTGFAAESLLPMVDAVYTVTADPAATENAIAVMLGDAAIPTLIPIVEDETAEGGWYFPG